MNESEHLRLALFFTRGVSLKTWDKSGMFDREVALYQQLQARGVRVTFVTYGDNSELDYASRLPGIQILCNHWKLSKRWYGMLLPWLHAPWLRRCDVIKTNQMDGADLALRAAQLWRKPLVARCGYMWSEFVERQQGSTSPAAQKALALETHVFCTARRIVVTTPDMVADIRRRVPATASRIRIIPNYVDTDIFCPSPGNDCEHEIIFVGRLAPQKNVEALLQAVEPLNARIIMIGNGELRQELQQRFAGLGEQVRWISNVPNVELPRYLNRARVFVLASHYEGHPKTLIEAMACGLPVIGSDAPGIRELIRHGETGWLCNTDAASIRAAIQGLLARPELRAELGRNARQFAVENFALERVVGMELEVLHEAIK